MVTPRLKVEEAQTVSDVTRISSASHSEMAVGYSRAVRIGPHVAVSTTAALAADGTILFPGDAAKQMEIALSRALDAARELGAGPEDVIRSRIFLRRAADWRHVGKIHAQAFAGREPANTTIVAGDFIPPGCEVEIELDAVVLND